MCFKFKDAKKKEHKGGMCKLEMMIESERKKKIELNERVLKCFSGCVRI